MKSCVFHRSDLIKDFYVFKLLFLSFFSADPAIPVTECDFYDHVAQMKFHNFKGFYEEYTNMEVPFKPTEEFRNPDNNSKNRFLNVPCYDHSRVPIEPRNDKNTYIHANFVPGFDTDKDYILTQAPLPETIKDFWSMVFDHYVETIVMVSRSWSIWKIQGI